MIKFIFCLLGRQVLTEVDLRLWQTDTFNFLSSKPELVKAMMDPSRIFNMDETSVEVRIIYLYPTF